VALPTPAALMHLDLVVLVEEPVVEGVLSAAVVVDMQLGLRAVYLFAFLVDHSYAVEEGGNQAGKHPVVARHSFAVV